MDLMNGCVSVYVGVCVCVCTSTGQISMKLDHYRLQKKKERNNNNIRKYKKVTRLPFPVIVIRPVAAGWETQPKTGRCTWNCLVTTQELCWNFDAESIGAKFDAIRAATVELSNRNGRARATGSGSNLPTATPSKHGRAHCQFYPSFPSSLPVVNARHR